MRIFPVVLEAGSVAAMVCQPVEWTRGRNLNYNNSVSILPRREKYKSEVDKICEKITDREDK